MSRLNNFCSNNQKLFNQFNPPNLKFKVFGQSFRLSTNTSTETKSILSYRRIIAFPNKKPVHLSKKLWRTINSLRITFIGRPLIVDQGQKEMPKAAFYAVADGRKPGVYNTWAEAEEQVKGYPGAKFKKFPTKIQAEEYVSAPSGTSLAGSSKSSLPYTKANSSKVNENPSSAFPTHHRAESPTTTSNISTLPTNLQEIASKGYSFTKDHYLIVHTDGSALGNGQKGSRAGAGVFWGDKGEAASKNYSERVPGLPQTNNRGELLAVIRAVEQCPYPFIPLEIRCDSQYTISCMTTWLPKWLQTNFRTSSKTYTKSNGQTIDTSTKSKEVLNVDMIKHLLVLLRNRGSKGKVKFKYVPAHSGIEGNERADQLAKMGSLMPENKNTIKWLNPDEESSQKIKKEITDIEVELNENWLMSSEELENFEKDLLEE
uniref:Ribonuclease H n=1 Tax=Kwoniella pini CBS 10737 TaxID=1296096 RepID=A0A1B9I5Q8_9TREE|nr:uncharacterized protein I206_02904 [Kwoniella pini CBS 10737]OCF50847.1 hypothetical protein I206_02904 [Kwoniella pini CBS 10737]